VKPKNIHAAYAQAKKLVAPFQDEEFRAAAFGVLFAHALGKSILADPVDSKSESAPSQHKSPTKTKAGPMGRVIQLSEDGFFKKPHTLQDALDALRNHGYAYDAGTIGKALQRLAQARVLRRVTEKRGNRDVFIYSAW
jgi:hypothetical protein